MFARICRAIDHHLGHLEHLSVLDIGPGYSATSQLLIDRYPISTLVMLDHSHDVIEYQRSELGDGGIAATFVEGDLNQSGLITALGQRFCVVLMTEVVEHIPDAAPVLAEIRDCLSPHGIAIVSTPTRSSERFLDQLGRPDGAAHHANRAHVVSYDRDSLADLATQAGFQVSELRGIGSGFLMYHTMLRLLRVPIHEDTGRVLSSGPAARIAELTLRAYLKLRFGRILDRVIPRNLFMVLTLTQPCCSPETDGPSCA